MSRPQLLEMTGLPTLLLLAATTVSVGSWPAPHDTINTTQRRVEEAEGTPHTPALRPSSPESSSPLPSIALQSRGEVLAGGVEFSGPATSRPQPPKSRDPADELEGVMLSRSRQSSTSMHFFQSSSSRLSGPAQRPIEIGGRQGGGEEEGGGRRGGRGGRGGGRNAGLERQQQRHATYQSSSFPSSAPRLLRPDFPPFSAQTLTNPQSTLIVISPTSPSTLLPSVAQPSSSDEDENPRETTEAPRKHHREEKTGSEGVKVPQEAMTRSTFFHGRSLSLGYLKANSHRQRTNNRSYLKRLSSKAVDGRRKAPGGRVQQTFERERFPQTARLKSSLGIPESPPEEISVAQKQPQQRVEKVDILEEKENGNPPNESTSNGAKSRGFADSHLSEQSEQGLREDKEAAKGNLEASAGGDGSLSSDQSSNLDETKIEKQKEKLNSTETDFKANEGNASATGEAQQVNLNLLEMELSNKDEVASDLKLAIAILQHRIVPDLQRNGAPNNATETAELRKETDKPAFPLDSDADHYFSKNSDAPRDDSAKYNIEIFDSNSSEEEEEGEEEEGGEEVSLHDRVITNDTILYQNVRETPESIERESCYRWFVLVLDGNCSVIKQRMTAFVTYLKAALSFKLSVDYNDVYVPSVFCDNTFMVNISLDTIKNPQAEHELRSLAEANTTLLEISEEIFYLEKILTKRSDDEEKDLLKPLVKKPDDVELVIYIAVGCMCVFILLSVVIVALIKVCRPEGDLMDIGKPLPHHSLTRSLDFPIRRPNVIYSHRFSQALAPGKYGRRLHDEPQIGVAGVGVASLSNGGRTSCFRYDAELAADLSLGGDELYSIAGIGDDPYNDRKALVPGGGSGGRRRTTRVPGEDVIIEEDIGEEEEEEDEEEEEEEEEMRRRNEDVPEDEVGLEDMEEEEEEGESEQHPHHHHRHGTEGVRVVSSSTGSGGAGGSVLGGVGGGTGGPVLGAGGRNILGGIDNPCYNR
ncbi:uncharacterized protein [Penaeus vannamei]|uniref:uncharacterized protein n=1 Tax=Penaeus vannamei TaxID=6689 RepID=UPI00387F9D6B